MWSAVSSEFNMPKVLPCSSKSADNDGHESLKRKIESIFTLIDEFEFTLEEESKIHRSLDSILNICYNKEHAATLQLNITTPKLN
ncbi:hypothetical protein TNCV_4098361 [Trichonephila clavipes]|nr:hypothetical protein TNCV_4098361 [Trichonephila clavipes]